MKVLSVSQIRELDAYTIANEPISSYELMERAGGVCTDWILDHFGDIRHALILCGTGNNGGDGLVIAQNLSHAGWEVCAVYPEFTTQSPDFTRNLEAIRNLDKIKVTSLGSGDHLPQVTHEYIVVDSLFGSGLNKNLASPFTDWVEQVNSLQNFIVSIDIPSGLFADQPSTGVAVEADFTLSFEVVKLAFLAPENHRYVGEWVVLPIGLHPGKMQELTTPWRMLEIWEMADMVKTRGKFDHKGTYGHALLIAGSDGKAGAAVLACTAALRAGAGLVTAHVPSTLNPIIQASIPEVMVETDAHPYIFTGSGDLSGFSAIGLGCGIGQAEETKNGLSTVLQNTTVPLVIDADGLNILASDSHLSAQIPLGSILTPHLKEFERLFGPSDNHFARLERLRDVAIEHQITIVLKGAHTAVATAGGSIFFNITGNPGMATAGSGDVLTGVITGLLAQGYATEQAAQLGVFLHGLAGDLAAEEQGEEALIASDIIARIGQAYLLLHDFNAEPI